MKNHSANRRHPGFWLGTPLVVFLILSLWLAPAFLAAQPLDADTILRGAAEAFAKLESRQPPVSWIAQQGGAELAWNEAYRLAAFASMFEATGEKVLLEKALVRAAAVLAMRADRKGVEDVFRHRVVPAWTSVKYTDGKPYAWIVHAGMLTYPIARLAYLIRRDPGLSRDYNDVADRFIFAVRTTVAAFDHAWREGPGRDEGYYRSDLSGRPLSFNQQNALGRTLVTLWLATGRASYRARAVRLARYFKRRLRVVDGRYIWPDAPGGERASDIAHAAIDVDFAFVCFRAGLVFDQRDMQMFARTLLACSRGERGFAHAVDGSGDSKLSVLAGLWGRLGYVTPEVRRALFSYLSDHWFDNNVTGLTSAAFLAESAGALKQDEACRP